MCCGKWLTKGISLALLSPVGNRHKSHPLCESLALLRGAHTGSHTMDRPKKTGAARSTGFFRPIHCVRACVSAAQQSEALTQWMGFMPITNWT